MQINAIYTHSSLLKASGTSFFFIDSRFLNSQSFILLIRYNLMCGMRIEAITPTGTVA